MTEKVTTITVFTVSSQLYQTVHVTKLCIHVAILPRQAFPSQAKIQPRKNTF